jgi:hypothetical protein
VEGAMADCLPIEELFKHKTKGSGASSSINYGSVNSISTSPALKTSKKRNFANRVAKSPLQSKARPSPKKSKNKIKKVSVKPKADWNPYLTDDSQYKLSKTQILDKKKSYVSPRQNKGSPDLKPRLHGALEGTTRQVPINLLGTHSEDAFGYGANDQADVGYILCTVRVQVYQFTKLFDLLLLLLFYCARHPIIPFGSLCAELLIKLQVLIDREIEEMEEALSASFLKNTATAEHEMTTPIVQRRISRLIK